jgi:hypothetical protein
VGPAPTGRPGQTVVPDNLVAFSIIVVNTIVESRKKGSEDLFRAQEDILRAFFEMSAEGKP